MTKRVFLGLDIGASKCRLCLLPETEAPPVLSAMVPVEKGDNGVAITLERVKTTLKLDGGTKLAGVTAAVAAQVDMKTGLVLGSPNLGWEGVALAEELSQVLGAPARLENDVRAAAWGEFVAGAGQGLTDMAAVYIGSGIGGGVIVDGKLVYGAGFSAGEVGHLPLTESSSCNCGGLGCVEGAASSAHLERRARIMMDNERTPALYRLTGNDPARVRIDLIAQAAREGDVLLAELMDEAYELWTRLCLCLAMILSPQAIVFGGGALAGLPDLVERLTPNFNARKLPACHTELRAASLGDQSGAVGAAHLCRHHFTK